VLIIDTFTVVDNYGCEAPNNVRTFITPAKLSCTANGFTWMVDSNGIIWVTCDKPDELQSPCRTYCLNMIKGRHPFVDTEMVSKLARYFEKN